MEYEKTIDKIKDLPLFFVIGRARSGTTMIRTLLDAHPNVQIPLETPFMLRLYDKYRKIRNWNKEQLLSFYDDVINSKSFNIWLIDREKLKNEILKCEGNYTYIELCKLVYSKHQSFFPKEEIRIFGDKNPVYSQSLDHVLKIFPNAKFIVIIRDYRDHILSMLKANLYSSNIKQIAYRWKYSVKLFHKLQKQKPESFYSFRYEDFLDEPEKFFKDICSFLGIEYNAEVFNFHEYKEHAQSLIPEEVFNTYAKNLFTPIDSSRKFKWKEKMNKQDVSLADFIVGKKTAEAAGYKLNSDSFSFAFKILHSYSLVHFYFLYSYRSLVLRLPKKYRKYFRIKIA